MPKKKVGFSKRRRNEAGFFSCGESSVEFEDLINDAFEATETEATKLAQRMKNVYAIRTKTSRSMDQITEQGGMQEDTLIEVGMQRYRHLQWLLQNFMDKDNTIIVRAPYQVTFHNDMIMASLPHIFGTKIWATHSRVILQLLGLEEIFNQFVIFSTPRQFGKTTAVAMFIAAMLLAVPSCKILVFAQVLRGSINLLRQIKQFYLQYDPDRLNVAVESQQAFVISETKDPEDPLRSEVMSLPGTSKGSRGSTANIIILEEAGFMDNSLVQETVLPMLMVSDRTLIGISTPPKDMNQFYWSFFDLDDVDGQPIFKKVKLMRVCEECSDAGLTNCTHVPDISPPWQTSERKKRIQALYGDETTKFNREIGGAFTSDTINVFNHKLVDRLFKEKERVNGSNFGFPPIVFVSIDPSSGGTGSDTAIVSFTFTTGSPKDELVILAADAVQQSDTLFYQEMTTLITQIEGIKKHDNMHLARFVYIIEQNSGHVRAEQLATCITMKYPYAIIVRESQESSERHHREPRPGIWTTDEVKYQAHTNLNAFLTSDSVSIWKNTPTSEKVWTKLCKQMKTFQRVAEESKSLLTSKVKFTYTGKAAGPDDLIIALQLGLYHSMNSLQCRQEIRKVGRNLIGYNYDIY